MTFSRYCLMFILIGIFPSCGFSPGSFPYAETYLIEEQELEIVASIKRFRQDNPEYVIPSNLGLREGRRSEDDHWYSLYFYLKRENEIYYCWIRPELDSMKTTFALVSVGDSSSLSSWKELNKDFSRNENRAIIQAFESQILFNIKSRIN